MKRPFRFWMTGCAAVVLAGLGGIGNGAGGQGAVLRQASRYGLGETAQRLQARAARHGWRVFAQVDSGLWSPLEAGESLIVFTTASGGTPVLMDGPADCPSLPLGVRLRLAADGRAEVVSSANDWDLPTEVAHDLRRLPLLIADAIA